jgi:tRNA/tmRNA/rRNA uracil-C5-methylase (TrmA/RlmC/RlmD family)
MTRRPRQRQARGRSRVGERFEAEVGPVAHGGHCVVRLPEPESRVVFTRHTVPGERVVLEITEGTEGDSFWRADAVEVMAESHARVVAPRPYAGPGRCGGCDFQHVDLARQRALKADVVREQLARLAKLDVPVTVEPVEGDDHGLRWRTRVQFAPGPDGQRAMRKHRSREVVVVDDCLIARTDAREEPPAGAALDRTAVGPAVVLEHVATRAGSHDFAVDAGGFWQVHPGAPRVLGETVLEMLAPQPGERVIDLYAGVGLFARFLADAVGPDTRVVAVEGDRTAARHARENLADCRGARVETGPVESVLATSYDEPFDLVVLDPPREGARRKVVVQIADRARRAGAYVACDPAALARDVAFFAEQGYRLEALRAFDLFPMTSHVEVVALLVKSGSEVR